MAGRAFSVKLTARPLAMETPPLPPLSIGFSVPAYVGLEVKGKPFSALQLATGSLAHIYRDSAGRTRIERPVLRRSDGTGDPPIVVEILDPVAGCQYTLDTQNHIAHRVKAMPFPENAATGELTLERAALLRRIIQFPPLPPLHPLPGSEARSVGITAYPRGSKNVTEENLGTQRIEGVVAQGYRSTTLMPSRSTDDAATMPYVYESWVSPEIDEFVLTKTSDPRTGQSIHRLTHIVVGEPDPALFRPPADYQIIDESGPFRILYKR